MAKDEQGHELVILRRLSKTIVEVAPRYPGSPTIYNQDDEQDDLYLISCSDEHNDRIMRALMKARGLGNG